MRIIRWALTTLFLTQGFTLQALAEPAPTLSLEQFLDQVQTKNSGVRANIQTSQGAEERVKESEVPTAFTLFGGTGFKDDQSISYPPFLSYDSAINDFYQVGVSKLFDFGLQAKLSYTFNYYNYINLAPIEIGSVTFPFPNPVIITRPELDLTFPVWGGGFGRSVRAQKKQTEAQALSTSYKESFEAKQSLVTAETTYWALALARQTVQVQKESLQRAEDLEQWSEKRARLQLADRADFLQADAALKLALLQLQSATDNEKVAARAFNAARNSDTEEVNETLVQPAVEMIQSLTPPTKSEMRDDVKQAQQDQFAAEATAVLGAERNTPTLNLMGSFAFNGFNPVPSLTGPSQAGNPFSALGDPFSQQRPTEQIQLALNIPLNFGTLSDVQSGYRAEENAAELRFQRKIFEQEQGWTDLNRKLSEAKKRLDLSVVIEKAQDLKRSYERQRLHQGRTTTYQVLLFDQDFDQAQITRIQAEQEVLTIITQMKLYKGSTT